jgi:DNA-binding IclR family transcriptional regulator
MGDVARTAAAPSVAGKVAAILSAFSFGTHQLTLAELAKRTGIPTSTAYRLATELVARRILERTDGGYRIGLWLWEIGSRSPRSSTLQEVVLPYMEDLYEVTKENVHLGVLVGDEVLYVERITGHRAVPVQSRRAGRLPLHATGVGKVLLAYAPDGLVDRLAGDAFVRFTPHTVVDAAKLRQELAEIRRTGVAYANEELTPGTLSVAAPLLDSRGRAIAALSLVVRSNRADVRRLGPAVQTAARAAARELRCRLA